MPFRPSPHAIRLALIVALAALAAPALAQAQHQHEGGHQHDTSSAAVANLKLDGDKKWATDASLRSGMAAIHAAFKADHPAIHAGTQSDAQYDALAARIEAQVNSIVANCKLPPAADANLHYVVADLMQGVGLMRGQDPQRTRHDGAALVHGALRAYGQYFDDPDFRS
jgi:Ni/Co efflux regulator RcnB